MACTISVPSIEMSGVKGSGNVVKETRDVSGFNRIRLDGSGNLFVEQGSQEGLQIEAEDNLIPYMDIRVEEDTLVIGFKSNASINPTRPMNFYVTVKNLNEVSLNGSGNADLKALKTDAMTITINGSGGAKSAQLEAKSLKAQVYGSGRIQADGTVDDLSINLSGSGSFSGLDLQSATADITLAGSGDADVNASSTLNVTIAGSGSVRYRGNPNIGRMSIAGSGKISQVK
jgi:hypothetical protein